jgi:hypothetical protein
MQGQAEVLFMHAGLHSAIPMIIQGVPDALLQDAPVQIAEAAAAEDAAAAKEMFITTLF